MNWRISSMLFAFILVSCLKNEPQTSADERSPYLIEADELQLVINQPHIKIIDFRKSEVYKEEHIAGALNLWRNDIEDASYDYKGMMASKAHIEKLFGNMGISHNDTLIVYDDIGLCDASRLWWLLQNYDFVNVKLLHGGISSWKLQGGAVTTKIPKVEKATFKLGENPSMAYYATKDEVLHSLTKNTLVLDTRTANEFTGFEQKVGAFKAGRIPSSIHIDWANAINYNGDGRFKPYKELELAYKTLNVTKDHPIIVYCHSGVRSAHTTFVLTQLLGYENVKNYDGSWTEWSYFDHLPFETDSTTEIN
ncbi:sulfurtransferase [Hanstruepera marina]|uniref:sulfurtransferase n=1 Tax=Hanstruepera marina TaxID=2873265 RepID=UPI001CA64D50|nr:sulfurtransferase [Hanstruepera marina]